MKPERKRQLEEDAKTRTETDEQVMHILYTHLIVAFQEIAIAEGESVLIEDERGEKLNEALKAIRQLLEVVADDVVATIPGVMTREEALDEMKQAELKNWLNSALRPEDDTDESDE